MSNRIHRPRDAGIQPSDITPQSAYLDRRNLIAMGVAGLAFGATALPRALGAAEPAAAPIPASRYKAPRNARMSIADPPNRFEDATSYNNFYEFGTDKSDPAANSRAFKATPWSVTVDGECEVKGKFTLEDILKPLTFEERVYRLRCVEGWSMVIPWVGFPLADLLQRYKPTSKAKHVEFTTLLDTKQFPGQKVGVLNWPYVEGLRIDEAMHPLTILAVGLYGQALPAQNGAPLRLVVPWKYGFKNIKSIVRIRFTEKAPLNSWQDAASNEYGYYANVNPEVSHPRWSQATERRIGGGLLAQRHPTAMFNGYADSVASLYAGMDLRRNF